MRKMDVTEQDAVVALGVCLKEIPRSVARSFEGSGYVHHFFGQGCYTTLPGGHGRGAGAAARAAALGAPPPPPGRHMSTPVPQPTSSTRSPVWSAAWSSVCARNRWPSPTKEQPKS